MRKFASLFSLVLITLFSGYTYSQTTLVVSSLADSGPGTLRNQIGASSNGDTLKFAVSGTINLITEIAWSHGLVMNGPGKDLLTLNGGGTSRAFHCNGGYLEISGMTITNTSNLTTGLDHRYGGGMYFSGDSLWMDDLRFLNCKLYAASGQHFGGALWAAGQTIRINNSEFRNDSIIATGTSVEGRGGAIYTGGSGEGFIDNIIIDNCYLESVANTSFVDAEGGGIKADFAVGMLIENSTITNNTIFCDASGGVGSDAIIEGAGVHLGLNADYVMRNCTISNNAATGLADDDVREKGAGLFIRNSNLEMIDCLVENNTLELTVWESWGGGVNVTDGEFSFKGCIIEGNTAELGSGVYFATALGGSPSHPLPTLRMDSSRITNNIGELYEGAIYHQGLVAFDDHVFIMDCEISGNNGVGIELGQTDSVRVERCLISENQSGGCWLSNATSNFNRVVNTTFYRNRSDNCAGVFISNSGAVYVQNCTFVDDSITTAAGTNFRDIFANFATVFMKNNILDETRAHVKPHVGVSSGTIFSEGGNIVRDASGAAYLTTPTDLNSTDPRTDVFADHGGFTNTWSLLGFSPAIDHCGADTLMVDQRGFLRDTSVDAGAWEKDAVDPSVVSVVSTSGAGSYCEGDSATLSVTTSGPGPVSYQWYFGGAIAAGEISPDLGISSVDSTSDGTYQCVVTNGASTDTSDAIMVSFIASIVNTTHDTICEGDSALFEGSYYSIAGSYPVTFTAASTGCDSIEVLDLSVNSRPAMILAPLSPDTLCAGGGLVPVPSAFPTGGIFSGPGVFGSAIDPIVAGLGSHHLVYTYTDPLTGCSNQDSTPFFVDICSGMIDKEDAQVEVYPNPVEDLLIVYAQEEIEVELYSMTGQRIRVEIEKENDRWLIGTDKLPAGVYYLRIDSNGRLSSKKIIKQ